MDQYHATVMIVIRCFVLLLDLIRFIMQHCSPPLEGRIMHCTPSVVCPVPTVNWKTECYTTFNIPSLMEVQ